MKRIIVIAKGDVQRVGYRDEVERIARRLNITGYVENLKPYDVKIVAEGDEEKLKRFIELIKIQKFPIFVERLEISWHDATGEFNYFEVKRGEWQEELFERLDTAGRLLYRTVELGEENIELGRQNVELTKQDIELAKQNIELTKQNVELTKQSVELGKKNIELAEKNVKLAEKNVSISEEILNAIREESKKTRNIVSKEAEKTREEIRLLRNDLRIYIEENLKEIRVKISEIERVLKKAGIM
ncbi:MAG: acylphosphatase [Thermoprotei archaeon]